jgi:hypothetical protein
VTGESDEIHSPGDSPGAFQSPNDSECGSPTTVTLKKPKTFKNAFDTATGE